MLCVKLSSLEEGKVWIERERISTHLIETLAARLFSAVVRTIPDDCNEIIEDYTNGRIIMAEYQVKMGRCLRAKGGKGGVLWYKWRIRTDERRKYTYTCTYTYVNTLKYTCTRSYTHLLTHSHTHARTHAHTHARTHARTHADPGRVYPRIYIHIQYLPICTSHTFILTTYTRERLSRTHTTTRQ